MEEYGGNDGNDGSATPEDYSDDPEDDQDGSMGGGSQAGSRAGSQGLGDGSGDSDSVSGSYGPDDSELSGSEDSGEEGGKGDMAIMSKKSVDDRLKVSKEKRITPQFLTKYEKARVIGTRAL